MAEPRDDACPCFLPTKPPADREWWRPDIDDDPGPEVRAVARWGEDPELRRAIRTRHGWIERGPMVAYYEDRTPPMPWERTGHCWADTPHPVVSCEP